MARLQVARLLAWLAVVGFFLAAALLLSSYSSVAASGRQAPADVATLLPALWLDLAIALIVFGLIVALTARAVSGAGPFLLLAGCFPIATALVWFRFLGFGPAAVILLVVGGLTLGAAAISPAARVPSSGAAA